MCRGAYSDDEADATVSGRLLVRERADSRRDW